MKRRRYHYQAESAALRNAEHRCHQPKNRQYNDYGGRGIRVCDEWRGSGGFWLFLDEIGERPSPNHTLDRINNDGHYEPGNVRWATRSQQQLNRRASRFKGHLITYNGESLTRREWCRKLGIKLPTLNDRIRRGWFPPKLFLPVPHK